MEGAGPSLSELQGKLEKIIEDPDQRKDFFEQCIAQLISEPVSDSYLGEATWEGEDETD